MVKWKRISPGCIRHKIDGFVPTQNDVSWNKVGTPSRGRFYPNFACISDNKDDFGILSTLFWRYCSNFVRDRVPIDKVNNRIEALSTMVFCVLCTKVFLAMIVSSRRVMIQRFRTSFVEHLHHQWLWNFKHESEDGGMEKIRRNVGRRKGRDFILGMLDDMKDAHFNLNRYRKNCKNVSKIILS